MASLKRKKQTIKQGQRLWRLSPLESVARSSSIFIIKLRIQLVEWVEAQL